MARKKAVGYVRVSTAEQAHDGKYGQLAQKAAISEWARSHGYEVVEWRSDVGSGASDNRLALNGLMGPAPLPGGATAVIAYKSDRVARDMKLYFYYLYRLEKKGAELISTVEEFGGDPALANVYRSLIMFVAEQERKNITMRTSAGRVRKAVCGGYAGGRCAYGYRAVGGALIVVEEEAELVRTAFQLREGGLGLKAAAAALNEMGYAKRNGKPCDTNMLYSIYSNEALYRGVYKYKGASSAPGNFDSILTPLDPMKDWVNGSFAQTVGTRTYFEDKEEEGETDDENEGGGDGGEE